MKEVAKALIYGISAILVAAVLGLSLIINTMGTAIERKAETDRDMQKIEDALRPRSYQR
jgi:hypothetical protein